MIPIPSAKGVVINNGASFDGYYLIDCHVYDNNQLILELGGKYCRFFGDQFVSYQDNILRLLDSEKRLVWSVPVISHHDISVDEERQEIVVLATDVDKIKSTHYHSVISFDKNGKKVFHWNTEDSLQEFERILGRSIEDMQSLARSEMAYKDDLSDALMKINSLQVIPKTPLYPRLSFLKPGNILMNLQRERLMFVLDRETKKIVWHYKVQGSSHAGKINSKGNLIYFENRSGKTPQTLWDRFKKLSFFYPFVVVRPDYHLGMYHEPQKIRSVHHSTIFELDMEKKKYIWEYSEPNYFYSAFLGYIQELPNGNLLVTHVSRGGSVFEINQKKEIVWEWVNPQWDMEMGAPVIVSQVNKVEKEKVAPFLEKVF